MATTTKAPSAATKLALANSKLAAIRSEAKTPARRKAPARRGSKSMGTGNPMMTELLTATVLGWLQSAGHLAAVPTIAALGTEGTISLVGYIWSRNGGPPLAGLVGRVAGVVAANHFGRTSLDAVLGSNSDHGAPMAPAPVPAPAAPPAVTGYDVGYDDEVGYDD
jgi:hypothetical protein